MDTGEGEGNKFMVDANPTREPVELFQHRCHMITYLGLCDDPGGDKLNML